MLSSTSPLHLDSTSDHIFDCLLSFLILLWFRAVVCDVLMEISIANMTLHTGIETQRGGFLLAGDNYISQLAEWDCDIGIPSIHRLV